MSDEGSIDDLIARAQGEATQSVRDGGRVVAQVVRAFRLHARRPDGTAESHELAGPVVRVGCRPGNDLVLPDETVSRIHFEICADEHGFRLRDLGSTNGTTIDGWRVGDAYLRPGAEIQVGRTRLVFEPLESRVEVPLCPEERFGPLVGTSAAMRGLFAMLGRIAPTSCTVLIEGETGTGKERIAQALHEASQRARFPLVTFDCAAVPMGLIESEFLGHEKGAFTGAEARRAGAMEEADGGTLFMDEIGELPLALQPKLLRALEQREVRRVGGTTVRTVDVRILAATNRDLAQEVNRGAFRDDLYHRVAVARVRVPPLRERPEDVRPLVEHFIRGACGDDRGLAVSILGSVDPASWSVLEAYPWPGNVRELRNVVDRALALRDAGPLRFDPAAPASPADSRRPAAASAAASPEVDLDRPMLEQKAEIVSAFERAYLSGILARHRGKISPAASAAGIDRMYFKRLVRRYGI